MKLKQFCFNFILHPSAFILSLRRSAFILSSGKLCGKEKNSEGARSEVSVGGERESVE